MEDKLIEETVIALLRRAVATLPGDVLAALEASLLIERNPTAKRELSRILENVREARACMLPMCQDTGLPVFFARMGFTFPGFEEAVARGVRRATEDIPLRKNVVHPLTRENTGDNTGKGMPYICYSYEPSDYIELIVMPKGGGSENMSALAMLNPSSGIGGIKRFVLDTVVNAGGRPCPPIILGVGIGGTADECMALAKKALLRPVGSHSPDSSIARLEMEMLHAINATGIGPMGLGGDTTALAVHVEYACCHTASLPVAVNFQCYAARRARARIYRDGSVEIGGE
ncbi:fumarate hydratase alpha subunit, Fe-S type [Methanocella conradii HZ254]|uniref:Fumarate hydratase alpha subunit, Fe-S type n=2 Tax=Methanocella TaxID=570266 RepID=H8I4A3_METCZ|nr:fumarate hydratase alpha subunit, Fe-S type [Methanocella conradii HZ254]